MVIRPTSSSWKVVGRLHAVGNILCPFIFKLDAILDLGGASTKIFHHHLHGVYESRVSLENGNRGNRLEDELYLFASRIDKLVRRIEWVTRNRSSFHDKPSSSLSISKAVRQCRRFIMTKTTWSSRPLNSPPQKLGSYWHNVISNSSGERVCHPGAVMKPLLTHRFTKIIAVVFANVADSIQQIMDLAKLDVRLLVIVISHVQALDASHMAVCLRQKSMTRFIVLLLDRDLHLLITARHRVIRGIG